MDEGGKGWSDGIDRLALRGVVCGGAGKRTDIAEGGGVKGRG